MFADTVQIFFVVLDKLFPNDIIDLIKGKCRFSSIWRATEAIAAESLPLLLVILANGSSDERGG